MFAPQKPDMDKVLKWVDYETMCLLFGMMVMVAIFCESGFFDWAALAVSEAFHPYSVLNPGHLANINSMPCTETSSNTWIIIIIMKSSMEAEREHNHSILL